MKLFIHSGKQTHAPVSMVNPLFPKFIIIQYTMHYGFRVYCRHKDYFVWLANWQSATCNWRWAKPTKTDNWQNKGCSTLGFLGTWPFWFQFKIISLNLIQYPAKSKLVYFIITNWDQSEALKRKTTLEHIYRNRTEGNYNKNKREFREFPFVLLLITSLPLCSKTRISGNTLYVFQSTGAGALYIVHYYTI